MQRAVPRACSGEAGGPAASGLDLTDSDNSCSFTFTIVTTSKREPVTRMTAPVLRGRLWRTIPLDAQSSLLAKAIFAAWATAATGLSVAALVSAVIRAEGSAQPVVSGVGVSIGSLLAALFLWRAYSRVGSRSR